MANFSGAIKIGDLNDFIAPSQSCVLNLDGSLDAKPKVTTPQIPAEKPKVSGFQQTTTDETTNAIKVSLQDCLACSGCVTTAETMLLQHQSADELLAKLQDATVTVVASVSHQSIASLATHYQLPIHTCAQRLASFLKGLGVATVLDLQTARSLALAATGSDFVTRFRASFPAVPSQLNSPACGSSLPATTAQPPPLANPSATPPEFPWQVPGNTTDNIRERCNSRDQPDPDKDCCNGSAAANARLPMLISACPGWVCYAEKTHGDWILPHLSTAKSPQAMAGSLIKGTFSIAPPPPLSRSPSAAPNGACGCSSRPVAPAAEADAQPDRRRAAVHAAGDSMHAEDAYCKSADNRTAARGGGGWAGSRTADAAATRSSIYHVSIMPCYDKKLEAARSDFAIPADGAAATPAATSGEPLVWGAAADAVPETDSVLTTSEVQELMEAQGVRLSDDSSAAVALDDWRPFVEGAAADSHRGGYDPVAAGGVDVRACCASDGGSDRRGCCAAGEEAGSGAIDDDEPAVVGGCGTDVCKRGDSWRQCARGAGGQEWRLPAVRGGSGGYLEFTLKHAAWVLYGLDLGEGPLQMKVVRSRDFQEVAVMHGGRCVLRGAHAYGFRNIQNLMRKIRSGKCPYDVVEVMACPSGCLNGGGQVKVAGGHSELQQHLRRLDAVYHDEGASELQWPGQDGTARLALQTAAPAALRTQFHKREKTVQASLVDW